MVDFFATSLFCDDVRYEQGGKFSIIGIYGGDIIVQSLPVVLPKLGILVDTITPVGYEIKDIKYRIAMPGTEEIIVAPSAKELKITEGDGEFDEGSRQFIYRLVLVANSFQILQEGRIIINVDCDDKKLYAGSIVVRVGAST